MRFTAVAAFVSIVATASVAHAGEVTGFGSNPGGLKMFEHVPAGLKPSAPVVLVLHGCAQTADDAASAGWNELADAAGFLVVYPEAEDSLRCFDWSGAADPDDIVRDKGESLSIKQMVDKAVADHGVDRKRAFVVGFSSGGAMASVLGAVYPDVFAGIATISGIPYDCSTSIGDIATCMNPGKDLSPKEWGDKVRAANAGYAGPWPRVSVWQGSSDQIVGTQNRIELVEQWADVHGIAAAPTGQAHETLGDVETWSVSGMAHGVPISTKDGCGTASTYAIDVGTCAAARIAEFFGITAAASSDAGAGPASDGGASRPSSSSSSSSSSSGSSASPARDAGGGPARTPGADPGDGDDPSVGSTCSFGSPARTDAFAWGAAAALAALVLSRRKARA